MKEKLIEIITTGEELLSGVTQDNNFFWFAREVFAKGFKVAYHQSIGDSESDIVSALKIASLRSDFIIVTGGLGPTDDDLTRDSAAIFFNKKLIFNSSIEMEIKERFNKRKIRYSKVNKKQAFFPEGAKIIANNNGTAPGFHFKYNKKSFYFFPGVPREFKSMVDISFFADLDKEKKMSNSFTFSRTLKVFGLSESEVAEKIASIKSEGTYIGFRPYNFEIHLRLVSKASKFSTAKQDNLIITKKIRKKLKENIFSESDKTMAEEVVSSLLKRKLKVSVAESCTGGLLSNMLTDIPGSSKCIHYGFVTYGNNAKVDLLNVKKKTLTKYGAVSKQTVLEMSKNCYKLAKSDISVAISGIAGPSGGTIDKPVGTVFIGITNKNKTEVKEYFFPGTRESFKLRVCLAALDKIRKRFLIA
jgi:nicotinamide-nucleotide amidase